MIDVSPAMKTPSLDYGSILSLRPLVVLLGPTGIGKSRIAIHVAKALGTEVLTADSTQVYRGMDIGTDKPSLAEQAGIPHRLIDLVAPDEPFNAGAFRREAMAEIERLYQCHRLPLVVGGTGLYIRVLVRGLWAGPAVDRALRSQLELECEQSGLEHLYRELVNVDPASARVVHPHDRPKILRALEVFRQVGIPISTLQREHGFRDQSFHVCMIGLTMNRDALYRRIEQRVHVELAKGLVEETQRLLEMGYDRNLTSMKCLGYRQMSGFLLGEYTYEEAVRRLKRDTRHFAKRQMTWFRKEPGIEWISVEEGDTPESVAQHVVNRIRRFTMALAEHTSTGHHSH